MIDTSGWAFMYPLLRLSGVRVACYTHYPTISTDMLKRVQTRQAAFNNSSSITGSTLKSAAKLLYYYLFAAVYGAAGGCANVSLTYWTIVQMVPPLPFTCAHGATFCMYHVLAAVLSTLQHAYRL